MAARPIREEPDDRRAEPRRGRRSLAAGLLALAALALAGCGETEAGTPTTPRPDAQAPSAGAGGANTAEVVAAADAFLRTLTPEQRETALFDLDDPLKRSNWSNFPVGAQARNGIPLRDMNPEQRTAALAVMEAALSEQGYERMNDIRTADGYLRGLEPDGPGFDEEAYYLSFFGPPSETERFMLQFGGHHLAHNFTYEGEDVSLSPTLTAVEPPRFQVRGRSFAPLEDERASAFGAIGALDEAQREAAEIDGSFDDLLLGPQSDGPFPQPEGVLVSDLGPRARERVTAMLRAWVGDIDEEAAGRLVKKYESEFDQTRLGWSGSTDIENEEGYIRLDGPSAWIEFSNQAGDEGVHHHTIFRDQTADYGGS